MRIGWLTALLDQQFKTRWAGRREGGGERRRLTMSVRACVRDGEVKEGPIGAHLRSSAVSWMLSPTRRIASVAPPFAAFFLGSLPSSMTGELFDPGLLSFLFCCVVPSDAPPPPPPPPPSLSWRSLSSSPPRRNRRTKPPWLSDTCGTYSISTAFFGAAVSVLSRIFPIAEAGRSWSSERRGANGGGREASASTARELT